MIYITGDTHGDLSRFDNPLVKKLKSGDNLIICGDFGFIWEGNEKEYRILNSLGNHKYNIFFVDGKHENFDRLEKYEIIDAFGAKIRHISGNLYHMLRGHIYNIENKKIFTFGGGESHDKDFRIDMGTWWPQEMPSISEMKASVDVLDDNDRCVDYIITHEPPAIINKMIDKNHFTINPLEVFFDSMTKEIKFEKWFFGCTHINRKIANKYYSIFDDVIPVEEIPHKGFFFKRER